MKRRLLGPALALVIPLSVLGLALFILSRLGLLGRFLLSSAFQGTSIVLACVAVVFAFMHIKRMEDIAKCMSTRYIGVFPKDLEDIVEVVRTASWELLIMTDSVAYGHYSKPEAHQRFIDELHKARARGVKIRFLVYDDGPRLQAMNRQFDPQKFSKTQDSREFDHYFRRAFSGIKTPDTHASLLDRLGGEEREFRRQLLARGVEICFLPTEEQLFFWLEDDDDAVFSFENIGAADPLCFRTRDAKLIETFRCIFDGKWPIQPAKAEAA